MKKVFSLILAVVMVASLASVALAADHFDYLTSKIKDVGCYGYVNDYYTLKDGALSKATDLTKVFGKTYYMPILANSTKDDNDNYTGDSLAEGDDVYLSTNYACFAKQIGSLNVSATWTEGGEFIKSVSIKPIFVLTDCDGTGNANEGDSIKRNIYAIAIETTGDATKEKPVVGEILVTGKAGSGEGSYKVEQKIPVDWKIYYDTTTIAALPTATVATLVLERTGNNKYTKCEFTAADNQNTVTFNGDVKATVDGDLEGKYRVSFNSIDDATVIAANPDAAIMCYSIELNFRKAAEIEINPIDEEGTNYLYQKLPSGAIKDLTSTYVEDDGLFEFTARKLAGTYYVSDMPLVF